MKMLVTIEKLNQNCSTFISFLFLFPPFAAQLKMGDYHWYGYHGDNDTEKAVDFYGKAAKQKDPQVSLQGLTK